MNPLHPILEHIILQFNEDCRDENHLKTMRKRIDSVRASMVSIRDNRGVITAECRRGLPSNEGSTYCITISDSHYHCSCMAFTTNQRGEDGLKIACKHIIFVACSFAVHLSRTGCSV